MMEHVGIMNMGLLYIFHEGGLALLLKQPIDIKKSINHIDARMLSMGIDIQSTNFTLVKVNAPNKIEKQKIYFLNLHDYYFIMKINMH